MKPPTEALFSSDLWLRALEKYASETHLTVKLFDADERVVFGPVHLTPLFQLFEEKGYDPAIFTECAHRCLAQTNGRPAVLVSEFYGLTVVGTSLKLEGEIVGAAVAGYAFVDFSQLSEIQRLAKNAGLKFERIWEVAREQKPVPRHRLMLNGELLQVLGDALLRENHRTRLYEDAVLKLEEVARAKDQAHSELQHTTLALRESERRFREMIDALPAAIYTTDAEGRLTHFNPTAVELSGRIPELGTDQWCVSWKMFKPDGKPLPHDECPMAVALKEGRIERGAEAILERPDGKRLWFTPYPTPLRDAVGKIVGGINMLVDITERKQAEEAVRRSESNLRDFIENATIGLHWVGPDGIIQWANQAELDLLGYKHDEYIGRHISEFHADQAVIDDILVRLIRGETLHEHEARLRHKDGSIRHVLISSNVLFENGKFIHTRCFTRDITERKLAEEALREAAERFRFMAESMPQKIFTAKPNGEVDYLNQQWMEYTGLAFEQIKDWGWKQFIHPDDVAENVRVWQHSIDTGEYFQFEHRFRRVDGSYRWHLSRAVPMRDASGNITMWIGSNTDIQAIRDQEERLRKVEKMAAAGQLAASMAHEINNPLSSVTNSLYLLGKHPNLDESARFFVTTAATELARVSRIVKQSLSYYRVGTTPRDLDLGEIVNESLKIFSEKIQKAGIELKPKIHSGTLLVGYPDELRQVIDNLLLNALEAMPLGGGLSISVHDSFDWKHDRKQRDGVRLTIADTGCGIPKEHRWRIFEPFFTTKTEKGTGLGLWILQGIIAKHDGVMSLRSSDVEDKSGTIISIFLPSHTRKLPETKPSSSAESAA